MNECFSQKLTETSKCARGRKHRNILCGLNPIIIIITSRIYNLGSSYSTIVVRITKRSLWFGHAVCSEFKRK